jgi:hypothetical protein
MQEEIGSEASGCSPVAAQDEVSVTELHQEEYRGWIRVDNYGESDDVLFLCDLEGRSDDDNLLTETLENDIDQYGNLLTVRYWISREKRTKEELTTDHLRVALGVGAAKFIEHYSDYTGYLWTDEELMIGGHDLLEELKSFKGSFVHMEIEYRKN